MKKKHKGAHDLSSDRCQPMNRHLHTTPNWQQMRTQSTPPAGKRHNNSNLTTHTLYRANCKQTFPFRDQHVFSPPKLRVSRTITSCCTNCRRTKASRKAHTAAPIASRQSSSAAPIANRQSPSAAPIASNHLLPHQLRADNHLLLHRIASRQSHRWRNL